MSDKELVNLTCPKCSASQDVLIWHSLNSTLDPKAKKDLFDLRINRFHCDSCEKDAPVLAELLYHDMEREFCASYVPFETLTDDETLDRFDGGGRFSAFDDEDQEAFHEADYLSNVHVVFDMSELVRYVAFRERLHEMSSGPPQIQ
jgi:hypothetical protein